MAAGDTITQSLADSLDTVVASARQIREYEGVMPNLVDKVTLSEGTGTSWREISMRLSMPRTSLKPLRWTTHNRCLIRYSASHHPSLVFKPW